MAGPLAFRVKRSYGTLTNIDKDWVDLLIVETNMQPVTCTLYIALTSLMEFFITILLSKLLYSLCVVRLVPETHKRQ